MTPEEAREEAKIKALDSLGRYKFMMFGYHAALWVTLNRICPQHQASPFERLVKLARETKE